MQSPRHVDSLSVPKTGAFTGNRRLFAGFLLDGGYGGNLILRDMVQHPDGTLGTRFVPEMIPPSGAPIPITPSITPGGPHWDGSTARLDRPEGRQQILFANVPNDARITLVLVPQGTVRAFGLRLRTTDGRNDGTEFRIDARSGQAAILPATDSGGDPGGRVSIEGLQGLDQPVHLDVICRHDIVDVEVNRRHSLANRFWNPRGHSLGVWVEDGALVVRELTIRSLLEQTPPGAPRPPTFHNQVHGKRDAVK